MIKHRKRKERSTSVNGIVVRGKRRVIGGKEVGRNTLKDKVTGMRHSYNIIR